MRDGTPPTDPPPADLLEKARAQRASAAELSRYFAELEQRIDEALTRAELAGRRESDA